MSLEEAGICQYGLDGKNTEIPTESSLKGNWFPLTLCWKTRTIKLHSILAILDEAGNISYVSKKADIVYIIRAQSAERQASYVQSVSQRKMGTGLLFFPSVPRYKKGTDRRCGKNRQPGD